LWAMYPDGTHATLLTNDPILSLAIAPSGWVAAYLTNPDPQTFSYFQPYGYTLKIITLYDDQVRTITSIDPPGLSSTSPEEALDSAFQSASAYRNGAMAWSPDSTTLAFTSAHEAPSDTSASSEIYLYRPGKNSISRLTNLQLPQGPGHPYHLSWSPLGQRIYFNVAYSFGDNSKVYLAGAWVNGLDGSSVQVSTGENSSDEKLLAWINNTNVLLSSKNNDCGNQNMRKVNANTGEATSIWPSCYQTALYDRRRNQVLVSVTPEQSEPGGEISPGLYLVPIGQSQGRQLSDHGFDSLLSGSLSGLYSADWYGYNPGEGLFSIQRTGQIRPLFTGAPFDNTTGLTIRPVSHLPDAQWLWIGDGLYVSKPGSAPEQITAIPPDNLTSSPSVFGMYFFLARDQDTIRLYGVRARDWQPFIVDPRIQDPTEIDWTG
jgi:hypothetical protein